MNVLKPVTIAMDPTPAAAIMAISWILLMKKIVMVGLCISLIVIIVNNYVLHDPCSQQILMNAKIKLIFVSKNVSILLVLMSVFVSMAIYFKVMATHVKVHWSLSLKKNCCAL